MITSKKFPGPAISEGERPPTNPVIWVPFIGKPKKYVLLKKDFFVLVAINAQLLLETLRKKGLRGPNTPSTGEKRGFSLTL